MNTENKIEDGGPAFPVVRMPLDPDTILNHPGMTLRDWFAGQALAGYFANPHTPHRNAIDCAQYVYEMADAMIEAGRVK